jgi:hypothetical protein
MYINYYLVSVDRDVNLILLHLNIKKTDLLFLQVLKSGKGQTSLGYISFEFSKLTWSHVFLVNFHFPNLKSNNAWEEKNLRYPVLLATYE